MQILDKIKLYNRITSIDKIARRYFIINSYDSILTILGILVGAGAEHIEKDKVILIIIATAVAIAYSGFTGAFIVERAEREKELKEMERALKRTLKKSYYAEAYRYATLITALINSAAPLSSAVIAAAGIMLLGYQNTFLLLGIWLALLGAYLGKIAKRNALLESALFLMLGIMSFLIINTLTTSIISA